MQLLIEQDELPRPKLLSNCSVSIHAEHPLCFFKLSVLEKVLNKNLRTQHTRGSHGDVESE